MLLAAYDISGGFVFKQLSWVTFRFFKLLFKVVVRCCKLFFKLITSFGLPWWFQVGCGLFYIALVLQVVSVGLICVGIQMLWSLSSCLDRKKKLWIVFSLLTIVVGCITLFMSPQDFQVFKVGSGCLDSYAYLRFQRLFTWNYIVIG